ncbi:Uncharacterised protein [Vibrio cholerae]|nr:Uncharacterised protein [Vibrio cholerae]
MVPKPLSVLTEGIGLRRKNSRTVSVAFASCTPPPTYNTGRLLCASKACAFARCVASTCGMAGGVKLGKAETGALPSCTSLAMSTSTGPGRPVCATSNASANVGASSLMSVTK